MGTEYVSQDEIEAHKVAMQRVVEVEKEEQEAINDKKMKAYRNADDNLKKLIKSDIKEKLSKLKKTVKEKLATTQKDFDYLQILCQVYYEACSS